MEIRRTLRDLEYTLDNWEKLSSDARRVFRDREVSHRRATVVRSGTRAAGAVLLGWAVYDSIQSALEDDRRVGRRSEVSSATVARVVGEFLFCPGTAHAAEGKASAMARDPFEIVRSLSREDAIRVLAEHPEIGDWYRAEMAHRQGAAQAKCPAPQAVSEATVVSSEPVMTVIETEQPTQGRSAH